MAGSFQTRLGTSPEEGIKAPVVVASTGNLTLSGEQTVNTVDVVDGDRVLVRSQTDPIENGIYNASTGAWVRSTDFNEAQDVVNGVLVLSAGASTLYQAAFTGEWTPGVTSVTFAEILEFSGGANGFVPLGGTESGFPITGTLEFDAGLGGSFNVTQGDLLGINLFLIAGVGNNSGFAVNVYDDVGTLNVVTFLPSGKVATTVATVTGDSDLTLTTKGYVDGVGGGIDPIFDTVRLNNTVDPVQWGAVTLNFGEIVGIPTTTVNPDTEKTNAFIITTDIRAASLKAFVFGIDGQLSQTAGVAPTADVHFANKLYVDQAVAGGSSTPSFDSVSWIPQSFTGDEIISVYGEIVGVPTLLQAPAASAEDNDVAYGWNVRLAGVQKSIAFLPDGSVAVDGSVVPVNANQLTPKGYVDDNFVGLAGDEDVAGEKTFTDAITIGQTFSAVVNLAAGGLVAGNGNYVGVGDFGILVDSGVAIASAGAWGSITGTLGDQTDLQSALDGKVGTTGNETVAGIKTFSASPIVPAPTTDLQAATKKYVDDNVGGGAVHAAVMEISNVDTGVFPLNYEVTYSGLANGPIIVQEIPFQTGKLGSTHTTLLHDSLDADFLFTMSAFVDGRGLFLLPNDPLVGDTAAAATVQFVLDNGGAGDISKVGTPADDQVAVWTGDGTLEGAANLTYNGSILSSAGGIEATGTSGNVWADEKVYAGNRTLTVDDQFYMGAGTSIQPRIYFDATDYLEFRRDSNVYTFFIGAAGKFSVDSSGAHAGAGLTVEGSFVTGDLHMAQVANPDLTGGDTDGRLQISSYLDASGANIVLYGPTHATVANDINFRAGATSALYYDDSAGLWDFQGLKIADVLDPTAAQDAATKGYVDANTGGGGTGVSDHAHGSIVSDGSGVQDVANTEGVTSVTITGSAFRVLLSTPLTSAQQIVTTGAHKNSTDDVDILYDKIDDSNIDIYYYLNDVANTGSGVEFSFRVIDSNVSGIGGAEGLHAKGNFVSDGVGAQSIADCQGIASIAISGTDFVVTLSKPLTQAKQVITVGGSGGIAGPGTAPAIAVTKVSDTVFNLTWSLDGVASIASPLNLNFMVVDSDSVNAATISGWQLPIASGHFLTTNGGSDGASPGVASYTNQATNGMFWINLEQALTSINNVHMTGSIRQGTLNSKNFSYSALSNTVVRVEISDNSGVAADAGITFQIFDRGL